MTCITDAIGPIRGTLSLSFPTTYQKCWIMSALFIEFCDTKFVPPHSSLVTFKTGLPQQQMWTHLAAKAKQPDEVPSLPSILSQSEGSGFVTHVTRNCNWTTFVNAAAISYRQNPAPSPRPSRHAVVVRFKRVVRIRVLVSGNMHLEALLLLHSRLSSEARKNPTPASFSDTLCQIRFMLFSPCYPGIGSGTGTGTAGYCCEFRSTTQVKSPWGGGGV